MNFLRENKSTLYDRKYDSKPRRQVLSPSLVTTLTKRGDNAAFATGVREVGHGEWYFAWPVAVGLSRGARFRNARDIAGATGRESCRQGRWSHRRCRQD